MQTLSEITENSASHPVRRGALAGLSHVQRTEGVGQQLSSPFQTTIIVPVVVLMGFGRDVPEKLSSQVLSEQLSFQQLYTSTVS